MVCGFTVQKWVRLKLKLKYKYIYITVKLAILASANQRTVLFECGQELLCEKRRDSVRRWLSVSREKDTRTNGFTHKYSMYLSLQHQATAGQTCLCLFSFWGQTKHISLGHYTFFIMPDGTAKYIKLKYTIKTKAINIKWKKTDYMALKVYFLHCPVFVVETDVSLS